MGEWGGGGAVYNGENTSLYIVDRIVRIVWILLAAGGGKKQIMSARESLCELFSKDFIYTFYPPGFPCIYIYEKVQTCF